jgi:hypothetical protein
LIKCGIGERSLFHPLHFAVCIREDSPLAAADYLLTLFDGLAIITPFYNAPATGSAARQISIPDE